MHPNDATVVVIRNHREDYAESEKQLCEATVVTVTGKQYCLIIDEAEAQRLREWATAKSITTRHCDGYSSRPVEPAK
jgi:hypothetical protein